MSYKHYFNFEFVVNHELEGVNEKEWNIIDEAAIMKLKRILEEINYDDLKTCLEHVTTHQCKN
jgi:hypothetical protein